jgi:hypothetical protein
LAIAAAMSSAGVASIGWTGRCSATAKRARPAPPWPSPCDSAIRATSPRRPVTIAARRTSAAGSPAAAATASSITPSSAPWRNSPMSRRTRKSCSAAVARSNKARRVALRAAVEPLPAVAATAPSAASASPSVSCGSGAGVPRSVPSVAQPTPIRPCRASPESHATAISTSSGAAPRSRSAIASRLASRLDVPAARSEAATRSASRVAIGSFSTPP